MSRRKLPKPAKVRQGSVPLSAEIAMWHAGTHAEAIVDSICRSTHLGVEWQALLLRGMTHARYEGGEMICDAPQRDSNSPCARHFLLFCMDILKHIVRTEDTDHEFKVRGKKYAWWGKQHEPKTRDPLELDQLMADKEANAEIHGTKPMSRWRFNRRYVRVRNEEGKHQQHGIAGRTDRGVRTISRYAAVAKKLGLFMSSQPRNDAPDAVMPRFGSYAYPEWILLKKPPEGLLKRLRHWWGEVTRAGKPLRQRAGEPPRVAPALTVSPRGPPQARLHAAQPDEDLDRDIGLSLTELDDLEQLCGI